MIKFKELRWTNAFSYAGNNKISLDSNQLTQLIGKNGFGKSSVALILEEVLYNQNSKKIKKGDILNRHVKDKSYSIELDFEKDGTNYTIRTTRNTTSGTVALLCNGVDISNHTATGTYKTIENIIGFDHKTFSQIVYQSSVSALEFLTATDTARKKFLIELLNLTKYTEASDVFKTLASDTTKQMDATAAKISTVSAWIDKYKTVDTTIKSLEQEPPPPTDYSDKIAVLKNELRNIDTTNKKINTNNTYKKVLDSLAVPDIVPISSKEDVVTLKAMVMNLKVKLSEGKLLTKKCTGPTTQCPVCSQDVDNSTMFKMSQEFESGRKALEDDIASLEFRIKEAVTQNAEFAAYTAAVAEWEKYHALYDPKLSQILLSKEDITYEIRKLTEIMDDTNAFIQGIRLRNIKVTEHNSTAKVVGAQMVEMKKDLNMLVEEVALLNDNLTKLQILVKSFSTTGLVAYKIECLVKDLESITNEYLGVLASGRFQLSFKIASSDKLNVVITDNGRDIDITALSSGERARVNVATLLAIRKIMQTLSNSRTNLLILDETVENLDTEGKEKLIEVLLGEQSLNTFLISHGFSHPLLEKVSVVKEQNISRLE
jgi:DNA repair exonuclease SbcCD ATPase subunit